MIGMEIVTQILFWFAFFDSFLGFGNIPIQRSWLLLLLVFLSALTTWIRKKSNRLAVFLLIHIALIIATGIFFIGVIYKPIYSVVGIVFLIFSMLLRSADGLKELEKPNIVYLAALAVLYLASVCLKSETGRIETYWCFFAILIMRIIYSNFKAVDQFVFDRKSSTKMDVIHFKKMSRSISLIYAAGLTLLLGAVSLIRTGTVSEYLLNQLRKFLIWLFHFVPEGDPAANAAAEEMPTQNMELGNDLPGNSDPSILSDIIEKILVNFTKIVIVLLIVAMIWSIIVAVYRAFYQKHVSEDVEEFIFKEERRKKLSKVQVQDEPHIWDFDPKKRMRKLYRKKMKGFWGKKEAPPVSLTPQEQLAMQKQQEEEKIRELYERARYSQEEITKEEVHSMQDLFEQKQ